MERNIRHLRDLALSAVQGTETPTAIPRLTIWSSPRRIAPTQAMFEPKFYVLLQGAKRLTMGTRAFEMRSGDCVVSSVGMPFTGQVMEATPDEPYVGLALKFDPVMLTELLLDMPEKDDPSIPAIAISTATDEIVEPLRRMLRLLATPEDIPVLAPLAERELYYRLLQSPMSNTLRQAVQVHSRFSQIKTSVDWICHNATHAMSVKELADTVGMSVTSFHRHFKAVTGLSPLVYQRQVRLLQARELLNGQQTSVTDVAFAVGYASSSQFSREYSRMFGWPPRKEIKRSKGASLP